MDSICTSNFNSFKKLLLLISLTFVSISVIAQRSAPVIASSSLPYMYVCGPPDTFRVVVQNTSLTDTLVNISMLISMPIGLEYIPGSIILAMVWLVKFLLRIYHIH